MAREEVPGFAGVYFDENYNPVVLLVDTTQRAAAEQYVADVLTRRGQSLGSVTIRQADFDFTQLKQWREQVTPLLVEREGVFTLDIDESANRLNIGVVDAITAELLREELVSSQIPSNAFHVEVQPRPTVRLQLTQRSRPVKAGFLIQQETWSSPDHCSLGFIAVRWAQGDTIFVTNSHCSKVRYMLDPDSGDIYQNWNSSGQNLIGHETYDFGRYNCYPGFSLCRLSDASVFAFEEAVPFKFAYITKTEGPPGIGEAGSLDVDTLFEIKNKEYTLLKGDTINKVGSYSGWTRGAITATCVDCTDPDDYLACQMKADLFSFLGDSGSPIFTTFEQGGETFARVAGLLWGGPAGDSTKTYYSPMENIERSTELGYLKVCKVGGPKYCFE